MSPIDDKCKTSAIDDIEVMSALDDLTPSVRFCVELLEGGDLNRSHRQPWRFRRHKWRPARHKWRWGLARVQ
jgi:hypothetical protein